MSRRFAAAGWAFPLAAFVLALTPAAALTAQSGGEPQTLVVQEHYSADQIDNLVGPVALYPDALLAQVLVASTFPDQIEEAARYVRINGTNGIDDQPWDVSVRAVAHYLPALNLMAEQIDWTATLGRAYASQSGSVMESVQRLRAMADAQGNLVSNEQQEVVREVVRSETKYVIVPAQPQVIYVPTYDPYYVYSQPIFRASYRTPYWSFGVGFPIGSWLIYDFNWGLGSVYYNGWDRSYFAYAGGWRARSFPYVRITNVYITPRHRSVYVNRNVWRRPVNYGNVNRYASVHRTVRFGGPNSGRGNDGRGWDRDGRSGNGNGNGNVGNGTRTGNRNGGRNAGDTNGSYGNSEDRMIRTRDAVAAANRSTGASSAERVARTREALTAANRSTGASSAERVARTREALAAASAGSRSGSVSRSNPVGGSTGGNTTNRGVRTETVNRGNSSATNRGSVVRGSADALITRGGSSTQPTRSQPSRTQPMTQQPTRTQPARQQPARQAPSMQPTRQQPTRQQPTRSQPARQQPARSQPSRAQPTRQPASAASASRPATPQRKSGSASGRIKPVG